MAALYEDSLYTTDEELPIEGQISLCEQEGGWTLTLPLSPQTTVPVYLVFSPDYHRDSTVTYSRSTYDRTGSRFTITYYKWTADISYGPSYDQIFDATVTIPQETFSCLALC